MFDAHLRRNETAIDKQELDSLRSEVCVLRTTNQALEAANRQMASKLEDLTKADPDWLAHLALYFGDSDAPAITSRLDVYRGAKLI